MSLQSRLKKLEAKVLVRKEWLCIAAPDVPEAEIERAVREAGVPADANLAIHRQKPPPGHDKRFRFYPVEIDDGYVRTDLAILALADWRRGE